MKHLDLCSGIGGFALAARWMGWQTIGFAEIDPFASRVLAKNFPGVQNYGDIGAIPDGVAADIITAGIPCQPYSCAGKRMGHEDDRAIWPVALSVIKRVKPDYVVLENVAGFIGMALDGVLSDLEAEGYETGTVVLPACSVNAPHRRDRVWVVAHAASVGSGASGQEIDGARRTDRTCGAGQQQRLVAHAASAREWTELALAEKRLRAIGGGEVISDAASDRMEEPERENREPDAGRREPCGLDAIGGGYAADADREPMGRSTEPRSQRGGGQLESAICGVSDELSYRLDEVGLEECRDAKATTFRPDQVLHVLRETDTQEALREESRRQDRFQEKEILQPAMRRSAPSKGSSYSICFAEESGKASREVLRELRDNETAKCSPRRFESSEQRTIEHHDVVRCLSRIMALEVWPSSGIERDEAIALQRLQRGIFEIKDGHVPETLSEIQEIWRSFDDETMDWIILRVSTGDPFCAERPNIQRISKGVPDRANRLKALGNSIVPQVVYQIFRALSRIDGGRD